MSKNVMFFAQLPLKLVKKKKCILASCPSLDVHSQGTTEAEAKKNLTEAVSLFFISCYERGTLDSALKKCGLTPNKAILKGKYQPKVAPHEVINVPIPFLVKQDCRTRCHA